MSRESDGFAIADIDTGLFDDLKIHRLVRATRDEGLIARCLVALEAIQLASWKQGERVTLTDAAPLWMTSIDDLAERLRGVGLLDDEDRIPEHAWESWFGPAQARREERREAGRKGGLAKSANRSSSSATAEPEVSSSKALPVPFRTVPVPIEGTKALPLDGAGNERPATPAGTAPAQMRETWPDDVPVIVQHAWHRRMKRPPTPKQIGAIRMKPSTWREVALLIDGAPAGAKASDIVKHVLDGLTAEISAERLEEAQRATEKERGRPGGSPTRIGDILPGLDGIGGGR